MPAFTQKDPRYKMVSKAPRRYRDTFTGELLNRDEFEKRTKAQPHHDAVGTTPRANGSHKNNVVTTENHGGAPTPRFKAPTHDVVDITAIEDHNVMGGPVPMADTPEPPPVLNAANAVAAAGYDVAQAAAQKTSDSLANIIGEAVALCANLVADIKAAPDKRYLVLETAALERVTKPAARIAMRHLPVNIEAVGPDGQDGAELFKGVMYCVTAIWANKQVFDEEMRRREEEYAKLYDAHYGPGSYARARSEAASQNAGNGRGNGQGIVSNGAAQPGTAGPAANGSENHRGDAGRTASLIHQLYHQHPGGNGQPPNLRPAI